MKLATWNVNSLKVRLPHVLEFLDRHKPDALCLQELKLEDADFRWRLSTRRVIRPCIPARRPTTAWRYCRRRLRPT